MKFIVLSKSTCPFCVMARELLEDQQLEHHIINFDEEHFSILEEFKAAYDWETVPMVLLKKGSTIEFIGGYTDLKERLEIGKED